MKKENVDSPEFFDLRNEKVCVVGLGVSGIDACLLLDKMGAIVSATDTSDNESVRRNLERLEHRYIETEIGKHTEEILKDCNLIVVSPGVAKEALPIKYGLANNIPIISEIELGFMFSKSPIIAITGTNGKSTTVRLVGEILEKSGKHCTVCGNIGNSLCGEVYRSDEKTIYVVEISSFQLEWIITFRPKVSCILNITENHLDRYNGFNDYALAKLKIFSNQRDSDIAILNYDDKTLKIESDSLKCRRLYYSRINKVEGLYLEDNYVTYNIKNKSRKLFKIPDMNLKGDYNIENVLAASLIGITQAVPPNILEKAVKEFKPLSHRMEKVAEVEGIEFYDDSKATSIDATKRALQSLNKKVILIAGGRDKGGDYRSIKGEIKEKVKVLILIGESTPLIEDKLKDAARIERSDTLEDAVRLGYKLANKNDIVLLSPMCSSFDMFKDYKHRGEIFKQAVASLNLKLSAKGGSAYGGKTYNL